MTEGATDPLERSWKYLDVKREGALAEMHIRRLKARNALDLALMRELTEIARLLRLRSDINAVILTGTREYFSAGADLGAIKDRIVAPTVLQSREMVMAGPDLCRAWEEIEAVTIAAVEGYCIGGGCALVVA